MVAPTPRARCELGIRRRGIGNVLAHGVLSSSLSIFFFFFFFFFYLADTGVPVSTGPARSHFLYPSLAFSPFHRQCPCAAASVRFPTSRPAVVAYEGVSRSEERTTMPSAKFFIDPTLALGGGSLLHPVSGRAHAVGLERGLDQARRQASLPEVAKNLDEWLAAIAAGASAGGNIVLVSHGNKMGLKLYIGDKGQDVHLEREAADAIRRNRRRATRPTPTRRRS